jgi:DNA polymerase-3 subunit gamma/tau
MEDDQIAIEVLDNEFTFKNVNKQLQFLEKVCHDLSGQVIKLDLQYNVGDAAAKEKQKKKSSRLKQKALSHPLVMEALELFDGKVIDVKSQ